MLTFVAFIFNPVKIVVQKLRSWVYFSIGKSIFCKVKNKFCENIVDAIFDGLNVNPEDDPDKMLGVSESDSESSQTKRRRIEKRETIRAEEAETQIEDDEQSNPWSDVADDEERNKKYPEYLGMRVEVQHGPEKLLFQAYP